MFLRLAAMQHNEGGRLPDAVFHGEGGVFLRVDLLVWQAAAFCSRESATLQLGQVLVVNSSIRCPLCRRFLSAS